MKTAAVGPAVTFFCCLAWLSFSIPAAITAYGIGGITIRRACLGALPWPLVCVLMLYGLSRASIVCEQVKPKYWQIGFLTAVAYAVSCLYVVIAWGFRGNHALEAGIAVPAATPSGVFILAILISPLLLFDAIRRSPRWQTDRRLRSRVLKLSADEAFTKAEGILGGTMRFEVAEQCGAPAPLLLEAGPELQSLLGQWSEIRMPCADVTIRRNAVRRSECFSQSCVLLLGPPEEDGPAWVCDSNRGVELFERASLLAEGIPWGKGWPSLSHYLVYLSDKQAVSLGMAPEH